MRESFNKIATFLSPEKRREQEIARTEERNKIEAENQKHRDWIEETDAKFVQLFKEGLFSGSASQVASHYRDTYYKTRDYLTLDAVEKQIRLNEGQDQNALIAWMNDVWRQVRSVDRAFACKQITAETKAEIEKSIFPLFGTVNIFQIQNLLKDTYGVESHYRDFGLGYRGGGMGNEAA